MTAPGLPSEDAAGTVRVEPDRPATGEYSWNTRRFVKGEGLWVQLTGQAVAPLQFNGEEADLFLAGWPVQDFVEWRDGEHDPTG